MKYMSTWHIYECQSWLSQFLQHSLLEGFNKKGPHAEPIYHLLVICSRQNLLTEVVIAVPEIPYAVTQYLLIIDVIDEVIDHCLRMTRF